MYLKTGGLGLVKGIKKGTEGRRWVGVRKRNKSGIIKFRKKKKTSFAFGERVRGRS